MSSSAGVLGGSTGIACSAASCAYDLPCGAYVALTSTVDQNSGHGFSGWSGAGCSGLAGCALTMNDDDEVTASFAPANIVFTSSVAYTGNLGGLAGADALCDGLAANAGLPGVYVAWLSSSEENARDRLGAARGWVRTDGKPFADSVTSLIEGKQIFFPAGIDENGTSVIEYDSYAWTGSWQGNTAPFDDLCDDWWSTSTETCPTIGSPGAGAGNGAWSGGTCTACNNAARLYCMGVNTAVAIRPTPIAGRTAFITSVAWIPDEGRDQADAFCGSEAAAAGLSGSFLALLGTSTESAASRFDASGTTWVRTDGIALAATAADFFSQGRSDASMEYRADGQLSTRGAWTGSDMGLDAPGTNTCSDWSTTAQNKKGALGGDSGQTEDAFGEAALGGNSWPCNGTAWHLYCLEE